MAQRTWASPSRRLKYQWPLGCGLRPTTSPRSHSAGICPWTMRLTAAVNWLTDIASSVGLIRLSWGETAIWCAGSCVLCGDGAALHHEATKSTKDTKNTNNKIMWGEG